MDGTDEDALSIEARKLNRMNEFERITRTIRAIRSSLKHSNGRMQEFERHETSHFLNVIISSDVKTRFDATLEMFQSVLRNKPVLLRMQ